MALKEVRLKTGEESHQLDCLANLLPWPEVAISGCMTLSYTISLEQSLFLWWKTQCTLPWQFVQKQKSWNEEELKSSKSVQFGITAS